MEKNLNIKIGIVGAGAAGLTAAEALKTKGYTDITVLERGSQAGGKCRSFEYQGRFYEMGAGVIVENNHTVHRLANKFGVKVEKIDFSREILFFDIESGKATKWLDFIKSLEFFRQVFFGYRKLAKRYREVSEVGLRDVDADLAEPFAAFAARHRIELVARALGPFFTGFGYDYFEEVPAAYVLKYYSWRTLKSFVKKMVYHFPTGIQSLWLEVAKNHKVIYGSVVNKIERGERVAVHTVAGKMEFDALILAGPLDEALKYLDASEEEKELFSKIIYSDYRTYALRLKDFPKNDGYAPGNFVASRKGQPIFWYHRYPDSDLYTFYVLGDWKISDEEVLGNIAEVVGQLGGSIEGVERKEHWKYFPHVGSDDMRAGFFDRLEAIQAKNKTYYVGESLNFSTVELSAEQAEDLVERFF